MLPSWRRSLARARAVALLAELAARASLIACFMLMAPTGNRVSSASRPMAMTKIAIRTSTRVVAGRCFMAVSPPARLSHSRTLARACETVGVRGIRNRIGGDEAGAHVDSDQPRAAVEDRVAGVVAYPEDDLVGLPRPAHHGPGRREQDVNGPRERDRVAVGPVGAEVDGDV